MTGETSATEATAICGAFIMVAFADGSFENIEEARFLSTVLNEPSLSFVDTDVVELSYNRLVRAFGDDYGVAAAEVLKAIETIRDSQQLAEAVKLAARRAIVADAKIMGQEEITLDQIAEALGLEKGSV